MSIGLAEISAYTGASAILTPPPCCTGSQSCQTPRPSRGCFPASPPFLLLVLWVLSTGSVFGKFFSSCPRIFGSAALTTVLFTPKFSDRSWWYAPARACRWKLCRWAQIQWKHPPSLGPSFRLSIWTICSWQQIPGSRLYVRPFDFELRTPSTPRNPRLLPPFHALPWSN